MSSTVIASTEDNAVKVDMRQTLTTPHNDPNNPFAFRPEQLAALQDPKNIDLLHIYGGLEGVARGIHADIHKGLPAPTAETQYKNITLHDITLDAAQLTTAIDSTEPTDNTTHNHTDDNTSSSASNKRTAIFGANTLPPVKSKNIFQLMWLAFQDKTLILLAVAAVVSLAVGLYEDIAVPEYDANGNKIAGVKWVEGVAIIVAILIVVLVGSVNDYQKEKQFRKLNAKKEDRIVKAMRDSQTVQISVYDIQVGDVLFLEPGDIVAADGIFIDGHNVRCDESAATGESDAVRKQPFETCYRLTHVETKTEYLNVPSKNDSGEGSSVHSFISSDEPTTKKPNDHSKSHPDPFIISGSKMLEGVCTYLVTGVGTNSYYGRTMMALRTDNESTPLQEKLNGLASMIAKLGSAAGLLMLIVLFIRYFVNWKYDGIPTVATEIVQQVMGILIVVVTIIVVAVPEGLPLAVTLALAYATQRMLKDNNLVRVLAACETMGNATTVCSDKTGTLTQNKMTVVAGTLGSSFRFLQDAPDERADLNDIKTVSSLVPKAILTIVNEGIAVNSTAFETEHEGTMQFVGNKTETALLQFSKLYGDSKHSYEHIRQTTPVVQVFPFSSERKAMAIVVRLENGRIRAHVKGASEILVKQCRRIITVSKTTSSKVQSRAFTEEDQNRVDRIIQSYATRSLRTIALAYRDFEEGEWPGKEDGGDDEVSYEEVVKDGLTLIGIVGIEDPLRPGVKEAVKACQGAGVFIRMVTGDNVVTAKSIAKQCGIYTPGGVVMEGPVFRNLPPHEMDAILPRLQVLARSSPEDKQILVGRLRELGDIVAVTGDGTNDGPALKLADVGFSMGIAGTEVAKEASSIILMDDNFSSIVRAIMWGRCVNDSVKKFLEFQITVNITAVILTFVSSVASHEQKSVLTAVQLLWVNLIMDTFAALALATDPPTEELLERAPEPRSAPLITFKMWKMIIGQAIFQIVVTIVLLYSDVLHYESNDPILQTIVFNTFVFCQIFNEINCRRIDSKLNVFHNITANKFFIFIFLLCVALQAIIVNFGGAAFQVTRVDGVAWAISIVVGLLSLPIGAVIRLIPDEFFSWVFVFFPNARERYLGSSNGNGVAEKSSSTSPSIYVTGNERIAWNNANGSAGAKTEQAPAYYSSVTHEKSIDKQVHEEEDVAAPAYQQSFEEQNQDTILSSGSLDRHV
ncbi:MAG: PMCA-type calcium-translocating P-type ATPase [Benjaminiella poitrasii]|nr:MAG: PMCA-type calcium-translocating P-type ATPase [Benjaminiella poitrasii]